MKGSIRRLSGLGDQEVAEWDTETITPEKLLEIEQEFNQMIGAGFAAFDITESKDEQISKFDPNAEILMVPRMMGGAR